MSGLYSWGDLSKNQQEAVKMFAGGNTSFGGRLYLDYELDAYMKKYNDYQKKQAEIAHTKADTAMVEETAKQDTEKARRYSEFQANNEQRATSGNKSMLSGLTGFSKIRRKVLGSTGNLGSVDEKLGG